MKREFDEKLNHVLSHLDEKRLTSSLRSVPLMKGDILTFTGETGDEKFTDQKGTVITYGVFRTAEGIDVAFSQIARRNNGLPIKSKAFEEAVREFYSLIPDDGLKVSIEEVRRVESSFGDGKNTYLIFKLEDEIEEVEEEEEEEEVEEPKVTKKTKGKK